MGKTHLNTRKEHCLPLHPETQGGCSEQDPGTCPAQHAGGRCGGVLRAGPRNPPRPARRREVCSRQHQQQAARGHGPGSAAALAWGFLPFSEVNHLKTETELSGLASGHQAIFTLNEGKGPDDPVHTHHQGTSAGPPPWSSWPPWEPSSEMPRERFARSKGQRWDRDLGKMSPTSSSEACMAGADHTAGVDGSAGLATEGAQPC